MIITNECLMPVVECSILNLDAKCIEEEYKYDDYILYYISDHIYNNCQESLEDFYLTLDNFNPEGILEIPLQLYGDFKVIFENTYKKDIDKFIKKINAIRDIFGIPFLSARVFANKIELKKIYIIKYFHKIKDLVITEIKNNKIFKLIINDNN